jgi:hypothetical protein
VEDNKLKSIRILLTEEILDWIKKHNEVFTNFKANPDFISFVCHYLLLPESVQNSNKKTPCYYFVNVLVFRDLAFMKSYAKNLPAQIYRLVEPLLRDCEVKIKQSEVKPVERPVDIGLFRTAQFNKTYRGHFISLDMNSAEPFILTKIHPRLYELLNDIYNGRKDENGRNIPEVKHKLATLVGKLKSKGYVELYLKVVRKLYEFMWDLGEAIYRKGYQPIAIRRDAWVVQCPKGGDYKKDLGDIVDFGTGFGQFKVVEGNGYIKIGDNELNYETDMEDSLRTKHGGESRTGLNLFFLPSKDKKYTIEIRNEEKLREVLNGKA